VDSERLGIVPQQDHLSFILSKPFSGLLLLNDSIFMTDKITFFHYFIFKSG